MKINIMKKLLLLALFMLGGFYTYAQTKEELNAEKATKNDSIAAIQGRVDDIQAKDRCFTGLESWSFWNNRREFFRV